MTTTGQAPLIIASNRGPVEFHRDETGQLRQHRGGGGLIGVLGPALAGHHGTWVAAAMTDDDRHEAGTALVVDLPDGPVRLLLLPLGEQDYDGYYRAISTQLLWFLHHHMLEPVSDAALRAGWQAYQRVNEAFARACADELAPSGQVLFQDYHLSLAPEKLRVLRPDAGIAHFTMIPWADPERFLALPKDIAAALLSGLLAADMVAFLVPRWADAFVATCSAAGYQVDADLRVVTAADGRHVRVRCFPVGVDATALRHLAGSTRVAAHRHDLLRMAGHRRLVVRVDRMEPSKNVLLGLTGFAELLDRAPHLRDQVVHYVLAYSSRQSVPAYRAYDDEVRRQVKYINDRFGTAEWQPVVLETENDFARGVAAMSLADVLVVNAQRDGMNLVAKEGPLVSERDLALVLSTGVGAADELGDAAIMVDPFDVTALADGIASALDLPRAERAARLARLREAANALPPQRWLTTALRELNSP
jgi:trehalose 6-phosphate synthase